MESCDTAAGIHHLAVILHITPVTHTNNCVRTESTGVQLNLIMTHLQLRQVNY